MLHNVLDLEVVKDPEPHSLRRTEKATRNWECFEKIEGPLLNLELDENMLIQSDARSQKRLIRVLTTDPRIGIVRHADAGYEKTIRIAKEKGIKMPMLK